MVKDSMEGYMDTKNKLQKALEDLDTEVAKNAVLIRENRDAKLNAALAIECIDRVTGDYELQITALKLQIQQAGLDPILVGNAAS